MSFTTKVTGKIDPGQIIRQKTFLRALQKYLPEISIHYGEFLSHNVFKPLAYPIDKNLFGKNIKFVGILHFEVKVVEWRSSALFYQAIFCF